MTETFPSKRKSASHARENQTCALNQTRQWFQVTTTIPQVCVCKCWLLGISLPLSLSVHLITEKIDETPQGHINELGFWAQIKDAFCISFLTPGFLFGYGLGIKISSCLDISCRGPNSGLGFNKSTAITKDQVPLRPRDKAIYPRLHRSIAKAEACCTCEMRTTLHRC